MNELTNIVIKANVGSIEANFNVIKSDLEKHLKTYEGLVVEEGNLGDYKKDKIALNKLANAIDDKRKEVNKVMEAPIKAFGKEMKDLHSKVKVQVKNLETQIKFFEDNKKQEKLNAIYTYIDDVFEKLEINGMYKKEILIEEKLYNLSASAKSGRDEVDRQVGLLVDRLKQDENNINVIKMTCQNMSVGLPIPIEASIYIERYKRGMDLNDVLSGIMELANQMRVTKQKVEEKNEMHTLKEIPKDAHIPSKVFDASKESCEVWELIGKNDDLDHLMQYAKTLGLNIKKIN